MEKIVLKNLTPEQVELIRKMKRQKEQNVVFCSNIACSGDNCPFHLDCLKTGGIDAQDAYSAICEYLDNLEKTASLKYSDIESLTESLNTFIDKCRSDKQFLMIKEITNFREKLQAFGLQLDE